MGEIGVPAYDDLNGNSKVGFFAKQSQIFLIWCTWFICTFSMIIILLNFLIAVITESYEEVATKQSIYTYLHKAELNEECYSLLSYFWNMPDYKVVVFSYNKEQAAANGIGDDGSSVDAGVQFVIEKLKEMIKK